MGYSRSTHSSYFRRLLIAIIFICLRLTCIAQSSNLVFEHLTTDHGLSSDKVEAILQDKDGFYWIATQNGLNRFDGTTFKVYLYNSSDSTSLSHNYCTAIAEDSNGDIWVATYKGVSRLIKSKGIFQRIYLQHPSRNFEITNRIYNLAVDHVGNIWIAGNGLWKYNIQNDSLILFKNNPSDLSTIPHYSLITHLIFDDALNGLWFTSGNELVFYSSSQQEFQHKLNNPHGWKVFEHADSRELALDKKNRLWFRDQKTQVLGYFESNHNSITFTTKKVNQGIKQIFADEKNRIWIFYWLAEAEIFDPETSTTDTDFFSPHYGRPALSQKGNYLFVDSQNNHWIASDKGISIYNEANQYYRLHRLMFNETNAENEPIKINALAQNISGSLWVATNIGLFKYDLQTNQARQIKINSPIKAVNTLCSDGEKLWIGIHDRLLCVDTKDESIIKNIFINPGIFFIRKDNAGDLWIGLWTGGLYHLNLKKDQLTAFKKDEKNSSIRSNNLITGLQEGNNFWVGYNAGIGFSKYDKNAGSWIHYHPQENDLSSSNAGTITVITKDNTGYLWLGTHGGGLFQFDTTRNTFINYQQQDGLSSNYINSIVPDANGHLWISTADGMNYFDMDNKNVHSLDMGLVFSDNDFAANGIQGLNDKLYFFCKNDIVEVDPLRYKPNHQFPQLVISSFKIFDQEVYIPRQQDVINLSHRQNFFSFEYSTIKTHPLKDVNYAYKLEGFDKDWNNTGHQNFVSYTNVPEGNYRFMVKATNDDGQWSDALLNLPLHIKPPFWHTWWFITLCVVFISSGIYAFYHYRVQQIKKIFSLRTKISQDLHDDIGGSLSSIHIYSSVAENEVDENPDKAKEFLQQINSSSREVMENISDIVWANDTEHKEKSSLSGRIKNYGYDLLSQKNIECRYVIDPLAEKKLSRPEARRNILLIIKEALNNMAKYSEASHAEIHVSVNGTHLLVHIADNGKGFDTTTIRNGNGLRNMQSRADVLGGSFKINSVSGKGTDIHFRIPIPNISDR
ncbi:MAG: two-component regulator propeller domain-containing protein, partial [Saprospiraceae bacterium]